MGKAACLKDDLAGGKMIPSQSTVFFNGKEVIVSGDSIEDHGFHTNATVSGSSTVKIGGKSVVKTDDVATCGHVASGSSTVIIG